MIGLLAGVPAVEGTIYIFIFTFAAAIKASSCMKTLDQPGQYIRKILHSPPIL